jgi:3-(3-hydroxy-phenyl)propionate hydroxylase
MTRNSEFNVVIVGFGPAGAVAACWLGQAGVKTLVVEKSRTVWEIPRAMALDHEILRIFQNIGVVDKVLPHTAPFGASEHYGAAGQLIRSIGVVPPPYPRLFPQHGIHSAAS